MNSTKLQKLYANRDNDFWAWRDAVDEIGIDATLGALGFSRDHSALWYNEHTGDAQPLNDLIMRSLVGWNETEEDQVREFAMTLENWLPQTSEPNPVIARSRALSEHAVMEALSGSLRYTFEHSSSQTDFVLNVGSSGASLTDGNWSGVSGGRVRVNLYDGREFLWPTARVYRFMVQRKVQPSLF